ncbi:MAG: hypothetical protein ACOZCO_06095 [Bacteroidota bacterium]
MKKSFFLFIPFLFPPFVSGGEYSLLKKADTENRFYLTWGYNRSQFSKSDIEIQGDGYQFTLHDVVAKDRPSPFEAKVYFNPSKLSIPQFNIRGGYFINKNFSVSAGYDHMKYVLVNDQQALISGSIDSSASATYAGVYDQSPVNITRDFLLYEHTNGCNYISTEADFYAYPWISPNKKHSLSLHAGWGIGIMIPRSDVSVFGVQGANLFHLAGYGTAVSAGIKFVFFRNFFFQVIAKGGYISLPDVLTYKSENTKASQKFWFTQEICNLGFHFNLFSRSTNGTRTDAEK